MLVGTGPTILIDIGFHPIFDRTGNGSPTPSVRRVPALVDTGAAESCIDDRLAQDLELPVIDQRDCSGISGTDRMNLYLAQPYVPDIKVAITGAFAGVMLADGGQQHQALLGRTFPKATHIVYDGQTGAVTIMFQGRHPRDRLAECSFPAPRRRTDQRFHDRSGADRGCRPVMPRSRP